MVKELELFRQEQGTPGFKCPFVDCARPFKKSGDLIVHFLMEVRTPGSPPRPEPSRTCAPAVERHSGARFSCTHTPSASILSRPRVAAAVNLRAKQIKRTRRTIINRCRRTRAPAAAAILRAKVRSQAPWVSRPPFCVLRPPSCI